MLKNFLISVVLLTCSFSCKKDMISVPPCIHDSIVEFSKNSVCSDANVSEYRFQGISVYVFSQGNCIPDGDAMVYNSTCNFIGMLGGIAGITKINGIEFSTNSVYVRTVWKKIKF